MERTIGVDKARAKLSEIADERVATAGQYPVLSCLALDSRVGIA